MVAYNFFDSILSQPIPINEIRESIWHYATDEDYKIAKFKHHARLYLIENKSDERAFNESYNILVKSAFRNGYERIIPSIEELRINVLNTSSPLDYLRPVGVKKAPRVDTRKEQEEKLKKAYVESAYRVANSQPQTRSTSTPQNEDQTPNNNKSTFVSIFGIVISKGAIDNAIGTLIASGILALIGFLWAIFSRSTFTSFFSKIWLFMGHPFKQVG